MELSTDIFVSLNIPIIIQLVLSYNHDSITVNSGTYTGYELNTSLSNTSQTISSVTSNSTLYFYYKSSISDYTSLSYTKLNWGRSGYSLIQSGDQGMSGYNVLGYYLILPILTSASINSTTTVYIKFYSSHYGYTQYYKLDLTDANTGTWKAAWTHLSSTTTFLNFSNVPYRAFTTTVNGTTYSSYFYGRTVANYGYYQAIGYITYNSANWQKECAIGTDVSTNSNNTCSQLSALNSDSRGGYFYYAIA